MTGWHTMTIGSLGRVVTGRTPAAAEPEMFVGAVPFITPSDMSDDYRVVSTARFVSDDWDMRKRVELPKDAVCVVCIGATIGKICMTERLSHTNQQLNSVIVDQSHYDPRFVYYSLRTRVSEFKARAAGAATPILNKTSFCDVEISAPDLSTQRRIATILGGYDDLIEVNRQRVAVLGTMARRLFEEWFVRFRFPGHESRKIIDTLDGPLPEGWACVGLHNVAEVTFGFPFKSKQFTTTSEGCRVVRIRDVPDGTTGTWTTEPFNPVRYEVRDGDLLVGMDGIFHTSIWVGGAAALNQRVTRLRPQNGLSTGWLLLSTLPKIKHLEATISGTTVAHLSARHLQLMTVVRADRNIQARADKFFATVDAQTLNLRVTNIRLAATRDLLLPRLISGELSVAAAESALEAAA